MTTRAEALANAEVYRSLGFRIQALRQSKGCSRAVLAHRTRISVGTIAKYEHGAVRAVDLLHLRQIATELGTTSGALLDGTPGPVVISERAAAMVLAVGQAHGFTAAEVIELAVTSYAAVFGPPRKYPPDGPPDDQPATITGPGVGNT